VDRPSWDQYFMAFAYLAASRSTCIRRKVGAVIVKKRHILATGYNGPPKGAKHCGVVGCVRDTLGIPSGERHECCRGLHGEQNSIVQAAAHGIKIASSTIYCTNQPCGICAKMIINANIVRVVYAEPYLDKLALDAFEEAGTELVHATCPAIRLPTSL